MENVSKPALSVRPNKTTTNAQDATEKVGPQQRKRASFKQIVLCGLGFLSLAIGVVGIFVPLLPTTEFVMLAAFLFMNSSPRFHTWLLGTKVYKTYVLPFKETGGIPMKTKVKMLVMSLGVLAISAAFIRIWYVWLILGICAAVILYMLLVRVPTREED